MSWRAGVAGGARSWRRAPRNAPPPTPSSDQVTITLPGHPLRGRPLVLLRLLRSRTGDGYADVEHPDGSPLRVPLEWADRSIPSPVPTLDGREVCLSVAGLLQLAAVVRAALNHPCGGNRCAPLSSQPTSNVRHSWRECGRVASAAELGAAPAGHVRVSPIEPPAALGRAERRGISPGRHRRIQGSGSKEG